MKPSSRARALWASLCLLTAVGCLFQNDDDGELAKRGSEVENQVYGTLVDANGTPVAGATVKALPASASLVKTSAGFGATGVQADSVTTDSLGRYGFRTLAGGSYNVVGDYREGALVVLHPGVAVKDTGDTVNVGIDTLRAPGSVAGRVVQGNSGKGGVLCYVPGTSYVAVSDDSGRFVIGGVPQGFYAIDYSAAGYVITPDSGIAVLSGRRTQLQDKRLVFDPALPPPAPENLKAVYDTLNERVTLTWDPVPVSDLAGYIVYRDDSSSLDPQMLPNGFVAETRFVDESIAWPTSVEKKRLVYSVKSRDAGTNRSNVYSAPVTVEIVSKDWVTTTMDLSIPGTSDALLSVNDSATLVVTYANPTRKIKRIDWQIGEGAISSKTVLPMASSGADTLVFKAHGPEEVKINVRLIDDGETAWNQAMTLVVLTDAPAAHAGADTEVSVDDVIRLSGGAEQRFGRIVKWEWDPGATGDFLRTSRGDTAVTPPKGFVGKFPCVLRVTDDDGNVAVDTMEVNVALDKPVALAGFDTTVSLGDRVNLRGYGKDGLGYVVKWEWDAGGTGNFIAVSTGDTAIVAPMKAGSYPCVWRVTDDDGLQSVDTILVTVLQDAPSAAAKASAIRLFAGDTLKLTALGGDGFGRIVKWEWDIGNTGVYHAASPGDTQFTAPAQADTNLPCRLRVTDDDGQTTTALADVRVFPRDRWIKIKDDAAYGGWGTSYLGAAFDGKAFLAGSPAPGPSPHQIWAGKNMMDWDSLQMNIPDGSWESPLVVMGGRIWWFLSNVMDPAKLELWSTADGTHWTRSPLPKAMDYRRQFTVFAFKGSLWLLGGMTERTDTSLSSEIQTDIWHSADGATWKRETPSSGPMARLFYSAIPAVTELGGKVWLYGGLPDNAGGAAFNDVWSSGDGINWTRATNQALPKARTNGTLLSFGGRLRLIGGDDKDVIFREDAWISADGASWSQDPAAPPKTFKQSQSYMEFNGSVWMFGGYNPNTNLEGGEIWKAPW
jgi:hypothetical protein